MASLDAALNRLAIALDALDARFAAATPAKTAELNEQLVKLAADKAEMQDEIERLRGEVRALDDLHEDMSARLDSALREVQLVIAE